MPVAPKPPWRRIGLGVVTLGIAVVALVSWAGRAPVPVPAQPVGQAVVSAPPPAVTTPPAAEVTPAPSPSPAMASSPTLVARASTTRPERARGSTEAATQPLPPPALPASPSPSPRAVQVADAPPLVPSNTAPVSIVSEEFGVLKLTILPSSEVFIDGESQGNVSRHDVKLSPGGHAIRVENPLYRSYLRKVTIQAGTAAELFIDLSVKGVKKTP